MRLRLIKFWILILVLLIAGAFAFVRYHRQDRIKRIASILMSLPEKRDYRDLSKYYVDRNQKLDAAIALMDNHLVDEVPYITKAELCIEQKDLKKAEFYYQKALDALSSPFRVETLSAVMILEHFLPEDIELTNMRKEIQKKIDYLRNEKQWKNDEEFQRLFMTDYLGAKTKLRL